MSNLPPNPKQLYGDKKVPLGLVPPSAVLYAALAMADGARKYGPYNWRENAVEAMTYVHACERHIMAWQDGEELDPVSGEPHLGHALACLAILVDAITVGNVIDNRPAKGAISTLLRKHQKSVPLNPRINKHLDALDERLHECPDLDQELPSPLHVRRIVETKPMIAVTWEDPEVLVSMSSVR